MLLLAALATLGSAHALDDDFDFDLEGYWRTRAYLFKPLYEEQDSAARLMVSRLRLQPQINYQDKAKFFMMADVLDDVAWGDNEARASTALFAGDPSNTGMDGFEQGTFDLKRAWVEFEIPVGLLRVGRQPSNWGMGLLANSGEGFDDNFGDNHGGSTYDRAIFATRPIAVAQGILGKEDSEIPLFLAVGVDRLVEDPLTQYYGYTCALTAGGDPIVEGSDAYDPRCDPENKGYHTLEREDYALDRTDGERKADWWADQDDDVMEMIYVLIYKGEGVDIAGTQGDLIAGSYVINRTQPETDSVVWIYDAYLKFHWNGIYLEGEGLTIQGKTNAIVLQGAYDPASELPNPLHKEADIWGYVARAGYKQDRYSAIFETGFASGDDNAADVEFTGRPLHSDFNAGLLIYEEILARVTAATWPDAEGLWSNGGVYNSKYIFPQVTFSPVENWEIIGGWLMAWPDKPDGSRILCKEGDESGGKKIDCAEYKATDNAIGWEADLAVKGRFEEHMTISLESGYARVTDRLPLDKPGLNPEGKFWTLQSRLAYEF